MTPIHPISLPEPPRDTLRSELVCTWPPGLIAELTKNDDDGDGNDDGDFELLAFIRENIDKWTCTTATRQPQSPFHPIEHRVQQSPKQDGSELMFRDVHPSLPHTDSLRLLCVHGTDKTADPVHCTLQVHRLRDPCLPIFEALSYTWADSEGNSTLRETIFLGPHYDILPVTSNCLAALRCYRTTIDRLIWVDAICINQFDLRERGHQVSLMRGIYTSASRVLMFVSDDSDGIAAFSNFANDDLMPSRISSTDYQSVLCMPYFSRLWVVQEVQLSKTATLTIGGHTLHWDDFLEQLHTLKSDGTQELLTWVEQLNMNLKVEDMNIMSLLRATMRCQCGDARDRVYGLMGLTRVHERENLPINYNISVQQLYTGLAIYWLTRRDTRHLLDLALLPKITPFLPSWVPDWAPAPNIDLDRGRTSSLPVTFHLDNAATTRWSSGNDWSGASLSDDSSGIPDGWKLDDTFWKEICQYSVARRTAVEDIVKPLSRSGSLALHAIHILSTQKGDVILRDANGKRLHGLNVVDSTDFNLETELQEQKETRLHILLNWNQACLLQPHADRVYSLDSLCQVVCASSSTKDSWNLANSVTKICNRLQSLEAAIVENWLMDLFFHGVCAGPVYPRSAIGHRLWWAQHAPKASATCQAFNFSFTIPIGEEHRQPIIAVMKEVHNDVRRFVAENEVPREILFRDSNSQDMGITTEGFNVLFKNGSIFDWSHSQKTMDENFALLIKQTHSMRSRTASSPREMCSYLQSVIRRHRDICQDFPPLKSALLDFDDSSHRPSIRLNGWQNPCGLVSPLQRPTPKLMSIILKQSAIHTPLYLSHVVYIAWELLDDLKIDAKFSLEQNMNILWIHVLTMEMVVRLRGTLQQRLILKAIEDKMRNVERIYLI